MNRHLFGWDLPPGVRLSDIPGNRPEDEKWEAIINGFWNKKDRKPEIKEALEDCPQVYVDLIDDAIEYGMSIGGKEQEAIAQEIRFYKTRFITETLEKVGISAEIIAKVEKILSGDYETP